MMKARYFLTMLCIVVSQSIYSQSFYTNPILGGDYPDPTIVRDGNDYYMTHSAFDYQPGLTVFHSRDLVNWEPISFALKTYLGSIWAPDISKYKDKFYIYFTVALQNGRKNYVTYASSPYGPWSDPIDLKVANIDPCHVVDEKGCRWLFMSGGKRVQLSDDGLAIVPNTEKVVYSGWNYPDEWITEGFCLEGPKLRKIGEYYYYLNAEGGTAGPATSHMVVVARSKSIDGPWENSPYNPLIHTYKSSDRWWSKGHGSLIDTPSGKWMIVYHSYENGFTNLGRQTLMEPVMFTDDGWLKRDDNVNIESRIKAPLSISSLEYDKSKALGKFRVGYEWKFYKSYEPERISVDNNQLLLRAKGENASESNPFLFVAGRHSYSIESKIELVGDVTAGLILYYNKSFFMGEGFNKDNRIRLRKGEGRKCGTHQNTTNIIWLRLTNNNNTITAEYSYDGIKWNRETWGIDISGYNHNTLYEFQSVLPGVFAYGKGSARFIDFKYNKL